jgi:hypothetical protein
MCLRRVPEKYIAGDALEYKQAVFQNVLRDIQCPPRNVFSWTAILLLDARVVADVLTGIPWEAWDHAPLAIGRSL